MRYIIAKSPDGKEHRINISYCPWCTDEMIMKGAVCAACAEKADRIRKGEDPDKVMCPIGRCGYNPCGHGCACEGACLSCHSTEVLAEGIVRAI